MGKMVVTTYIDRAPQAVFDYVGDLNTHPLYADVVQKAWITSEQKTGVGTTFIQVQTRNGRTFQGESEVIEWEPPERIVWRSRARTDTAVIYEFQPEGNGTRLTHTVIYPELDDPKKMQDSVEENERELANLKRLVETQ